MQAQKECYTTNCRQQCSPGHYDSVPIERKFQVINNLHPKRFPLRCFTQQTGQQMEAECFSGSWPQKISPWKNFLVAIERESPTTFVWKKVISLFRSIIWEQIQDDCYTANCRQPCSPGTKLWYLSNDCFTSQTTFIREEYPFGVSFNKLNDRWKQTVFSSSRPQILPRDIKFR